MPYIGTQANGGGNLTLKQFSGDNSTTAFTLDVTPASVYAVLTFIDGVMQVPGVDFTLSGNTITFVTAPYSGTSNIATLVSGILPLATPADGSVSSTKLATTAITGQTEDTSPDYDDDYVLTYDASAAALKKVKMYALENNMPSFRAYDNAATDRGASNPCVFPTVDHNIGSCYDNSTGKFTAPVAGIYHFAARLMTRSDSSTAGNNHTFGILKNGTTVAAPQAMVYGHVYGAHPDGWVGAITLSLAASDYVCVAASNGYHAPNAIGSTFSGFMVRK